MEGVFIPLGGRTSDTGVCPVGYERFPRVIVSSEIIAHATTMVTAASVPPVRYALFSGGVWVPMGDQCMRSQLII